MPTVVSVVGVSGRPLPPNFFAAVTPAPFEQMWGGPTAVTLTFAAELSEEQRAAVIGLATSTVEASAEAVAALSAAVAQLTAQVSTLASLLEGGAA